MDERRPNRKRSIVNDKGPHVYSRAMRHAVLVACALVIRAEGSLMPHKAWRTSIFGFCYPRNSLPPPKIELSTLSSAAQRHVATEPPCRVSLHRIHHCTWGHNFRTRCLRSGAGIGMPSGWKIFLHWLPASIPQL